MAGTPVNAEADLQRENRELLGRGELNSKVLVELVDQKTSGLDARVSNLDQQVGILRRLVAAPSGPYTRPYVGDGESGVQVSCLGPFRFAVDGLCFDGWRSGKARSLFQYLVTHRGQAIPRDTLISALWPDARVSAPATSLKVAVHALRQTLGQVLGGAGPLAIVSQGSCYQLNAPVWWLDVEEFEYCYAQGRVHEAREEMTEATRCYARAAQLYRGDFLEDLLDDWPAFRREALKDRYLFVVGRLAAASVLVGDYQGAIVWCQQLLAKDCCREDTYRTLMLCHSRLGQRSRVRSWYELCVRTLRCELDCEPEAETERVARLGMAGKL
jgi:two-component SAPR family response regulator